MNLTQVYLTNITLEIVFIENCTHQYMTIIINNDVYKGRADAAWGSLGYLLLVKISI